MDRETYLIQFEGVSVAEANRYAGELRAALLDVSPDVEVDIRGDTPLTQDFGATLVLLVGTPAALALARAIGEYIKRRRDVTISVKKGEWEVSANHLTPDGAVRIVELFTGKRGRARDAVSD